MRGADALIAALEREGVEVVFGLPGGAALPLYDALHDRPIRHVLMRHEAAAGHAAEGYAKATGQVGVALATSGPGATNLVTAIADAQMDSVPTVFLTGQVSTALRGTTAFQETDAIGITLPLVKHSFAVEDAEELTQVVHDAFHIARTGRPGPVLIDVPVDLAKATVRGGEPHPPQLPGHKPHLKANGRQVRRAAEVLAAARRPVLYAGGGVVHAGAAEELTALAREASLPTTCTLMALGAFPASDPHWLGMLGMHGTRPANWAIDQADVVLAVGARFDDRVTGRLDEFAPGATVIQVDVDPAEIGKNVRAHVPLVADARRALAALRSVLAELRPDPARLAAWWRRIDAWREEHPLREPDSGGDGLAPEAVLDALQRATGGAAIVSTDVGQHQMWAANRLRFDAPRRWLTSGGLGTMGFGLPAALGAQAARPEDLVVCVSGDGSLLLNMQELVTAAAEDLPVKVVIVNNRSLGMVRQHQDTYLGGRREAVDLGPRPDWSLIARACGCTGLRAEDGDELERALEEALATPGPVVLDAIVAPEADCLPMFAPGGPARDMVG